MKKLLIILTILLFAWPCWGATYYVSQSGAGDGSAVGTPDSVVDYNGGVFGQLDDDTVYFLDAITTQIGTPDAGTSGHVVTLRGDCTGHACTVAVAGGSQGMALSAAYVTVRGFSVTVADDANDRIGIYVSGANVIVDDCTVEGAGSGASNNGHKGIHVSDATDSLITNCDISHTTEGIYYYTALAGFASICGGSAGNGNNIHDLDVHKVGVGDGVGVGGNIVYDYSGLIISHNTITQFPEDGIDLYFGSNVVVEWNTIGPSTESYNNGDVAGIGIKCGSGSSTGNIIRYNTIKGIANTGANAVNYGIDSNGCDEVLVMGNFIHGCSYGVRFRETEGGEVYNNTISVSDRGIYISKCLGPELHTSANAASDPNGNEADATTGWGVGVSAGALTSVADPSTGTYALKMTAGDANGERAELSLTVVSGQSYRIEFDAKRGAQGTHQRIYACTGVVTSPDEFITGATYDMYTYDVVANATTLLIRIYAADHGGAANDEVLIDNLSVKLIGPAIVQNNITSGTSYDFYAAADSVITGGYNCLKNDAAITASEDGKYTNTGASDLYATDPKFVDAANDDFHLLVSSPCIDVATPNGSTPYLSAIKDMDKRTITDASGDCLGRFGGRLDMGCYEYVGDCKTLISASYGDHSDLSIDSDGYAYALEITGSDNTFGNLTVTNGGLVAIEGDNNSITCGTVEGSLNSSGSGNTLERLIIN